MPELRSYLVSILVVSGALVGCADDGASSNELSHGKADGVTNHERVLNVSWTFRNLADNTTSPCPIGFDTIQVWSLPIDELGQPVGDAVSDLFDCASGFGTTAPLEPDRYQVWLEVRDNSVTSLYARSLSQLTDLAFGDQSLGYDIYNDAGYFTFAWMLEAASDGFAVSCDQAAASGVALTATELNSGALTDNEFSCGDGSGVSFPTLLGRYGVSIAAVDFNGLAVGIGPSIPSAAVNGENQITELGTIVIPIDSL